jgi:hypothetical protein
MNSQEFFDTFGVGQMNSWETIRGISFFGRDGLPGVRYAHWSTARSGNSGGLRAGLGGFPSPTNTPRGAAGPYQAQKGPGPHLTATATGRRAATVEPVGDAPGKWGGHPGSAGAAAGQALPAEIAFGAPGSA